MIIWRPERYYPPLLTTTTEGSPAIGQEGTTILFGGEKLGNNPQSGGRADVGVWVIPCMGVGMSFFGVGKECVSYFASSNNDGYPILGRPFTYSTGDQSALIISTPANAFNNRATGFMKIKTRDQLIGADAYFRYRFLNLSCFNLDLLGGFLYSYIGDQLDTKSRTKSYDSDGIFSSDVEFKDRFKLKNDFYSALFGAKADWRCGRLGFSVTGKVGLGTMFQCGDFTGESIEYSIITGKIIAEQSTGFLVTDTNKGHHSHCKFEVVPQLIADVEWRLLPNLWLSCGFIGAYWPSVALAGEQVDLNLGEAASSTLKEKSYWMRGITAGLHLCF